MILNSIGKNKRKTSFIVLLFFIFVSIFMYFVSYLFMGGGIIMMIVAIAFSIITSFVSYYNSDKIVLKLNGARPANFEKDHELTILLEGLCLATGLPMPKLYVIEDTALNAFATGRNPKNAVICVTTGLVDKLDKYELEGVLAHELSHIKNYDIRLQTIVIVMVGFVVLVADIARRQMLFGRSRSRDNDNGASAVIMIVGLVFIILAPIFANFMKLALSRNREYLADASAAEITRNPGGLINALKKLSGDGEALETANKSSAHLYIVTPFKGKKKKSAKWSTHPLIEDRISRLENIN